MIQDDTMCHRKVRRGRAAWHEVEGVGLKSINDALMLESSLYFLLWKFFREKPYYARLMQLFHEVIVKNVVCGFVCPDKFPVRKNCNLFSFFLKVTLRTASGRLLAALTYHEDGSPNFDKFTMDRYVQITKFKQSYLSFVLPMRAGMFVVSIEK
jgi:farnesyl diphosphate synthase